MTRTHSMYGSGHCGLLVFLLSAVALVGCAEVSHRAVRYHPYSADAAAWAEAKRENVNEESKLTGIRYYASSPYLLVYTDGKGNLIWKLYPSVPDQTKLMVATPTQVFSKVTTSMTFVNGVLVNAKTDTDSTAVAKAVIAAMEKTAPLLAAGDKANTRSIPAPRLYKVLVAEDGLKLVGGPGNRPIEITLKEGQ